MFEMDFSERERGDDAFSQEDQKFLDIVKCGIGHQDGHYEIPCRFQNVLLVSVKFFPSLARAGLVEELRHLYVVVILWSGACARSKILR